MAHAATIPPRRTAPTRRGRHRPAVGRWPGRKRTGPPLQRQGCCASPAATALRAGLDAGASAAPGQETRAGTGLPPPARPGQRRPHAPIPPEPPPPRAGKRTTRKNTPWKRTLSDQSPGDLQELDRAVSYEESWGRGAGGGGELVEAAGGGHDDDPAWPGVRDGKAVRDGARQEYQRAGPGVPPGVPAESLELAVQDEQRFVGLLVDVRGAGRSRAASGDRRCQLALAVLGADFGDGQCTPGTFMTTTTDASAKPWTSPSGCSTPPASRRRSKWHTEPCCSSFPAISTTCSCPAPVA